ncbi:uncharacterized protein LOC119112123 [Pollicipes pollicipes]|uniref:uncharacterized protein LOC119112123 n=1 Tax=Pollicipes pollicipes TaxID=41117 RepID=UPI00188502C4|nr:uncharacterized protein LOC119112123 [Pollicipes pollicipes]
MIRSALLLLAMAACVAVASNKSPPPPVSVKGKVPPPVVVKGKVPPPVVVKVHPVKVPDTKFFIVEPEHEPIKYESCVPFSCPLNDQEASYIVLQVLHKTGHAHVLLNARTVRYLFDFDVKYRLAKQVAAAKSRLEVLNLEVALLSGLHSPLLLRLISLAEIDFVAQTVERNVQQCVQLGVTTVADMWAGYVYQVVDFKRAPAESITDFLVNVVLFLGSVDAPTSHPSPLDFIVFLEKRFIALKANQCTKVKKPVIVSPVPLPPKTKLVVKLVTISGDGKTKVTNYVPPVAPKPTVPVKGGKASVHVKGSVKVKSG